LNVKNLTFKETAKVDEDEEDDVDEVDEGSWTFCKLIELDLYEPHIEHTSNFVECLLKQTMHVHLDLPMAVISATWSFEWLGNNNLLLSISSVESKPVLNVDFSAFVIAIFEKFWEAFKSELVFEFE
jgi:hypothetical protein